MNSQNHLIRYIKQPYHAVIALGLVGAAMLAAAFWFQYALGFAPCTMCYWQRWPHGIVMAIAVLALIAGRNASRPLLTVSAAIMLIGAGIAFWHAGVEWKLLPGPAGCSGGVTLTGDVGAVLDALLDQKPVRCDESPWFFLGLSMAGWNAVISLAVGLTACFVAWRNGR